MKMIPTVTTKNYRGIEYIDLDDYDISMIRELVASRARFKDVQELIEKLDAISVEDLANVFVKHFFVTSFHQNDSYIAIIAIYSKLMELLDGDRYLRIGSSQRSLSNGIGVFGVPLNNTSDTDDELMEVLDSPDTPSIYHADGFGFPCSNSTDPVGQYIEFTTRIVFDDSFSSLNSGIEHDDMIPVAIRKDSSEELSDMLKSVFIDNNFDISGVDKGIEGYLKNNATINEYTATNAARILMSEHLLKDPNERILTDEDFKHIKKRTKVFAVPKESEREKLVGLVNERAKLNGVQQMLRMDRQRVQMNLASTCGGCNMVFAGPPGTAKTTLAREFAAMLEKLNIITDASSFEECRKSDIVGAYVGWTAMKVDELFSRVDACGGGVIFFDEIYTLSEKDATCYDVEAINCIVQNMENYRGRVFCIFAGYENKMDEFLSANPGIRSRIQFTIKFEEYDIETLCDVFACVAERGGFTVKGDCTDVLTDFFTRLKKIRGAQFGNGREARNLFTNAVQKMAIRLDGKKRLTKRQLVEITREDVELAADDILNSEIRIAPATRAIGIR